MLIKYYSISVITHLLILLAAILIFDFTNQAVIMGDQAEQIIHSYFFKEKFYQPNVPHNKPAEPITKTLLTKKVTKKDTIISTKKMTESISAPSAAAKASKGVQVDELLQVLHAAIQKQQHYPESAMLMEREGRATMQFTLLPDGSIHNLRLAKSSGTESLDHAALAAVRDAAPFKQVERYLSESKEFIIDVVFELS